MNFHILKPEENMIEILSRRILEEGEDISRCLIIFPGKRPAFFLRKYLAKAKKRALKAPAAFSIDGFMSDVYYKYGPARRMANEFDMLHVLLQQLKNSFCRLLSRNSADSGIDMLLPLAFSLSEEMEELKRDLVSPKELSSYNDLLQEELRKGFSSASSSFKKDEPPAAYKEIKAKFAGKIKNFSALYDEFYKSLDIAGLITSAGVAAWTAENLKMEHLRQYNRIFIAGFLRQNRSERQLFSMFENAGAEFFFTQNSLLGRYVPQLAAENIVTPEPKGKIFFHRAADMHAEIFRLREFMEENLSKNKNANNETEISDESKIAAVLPDAHSLFPLLSNAIPSGMPCNISLACPIAVSPVYSLYLALYRLFAMKPLEGYDSSAYISFLRHPYIKNLSCKGMAENGRIAVQTLEACLSGRLIRLFDPSAQLDIGNEMLSSKLSADDVKTHLQYIYHSFVQPFEKINDLSDFISKIKTVYLLIAQNSTASSHRYWGEFSAALHEALDSIGHSGLGSEKFSDSQSYFRFLGLTLKKIGYPFSGTPVKGIQILGPIETRSLHFEKVYFLDANADVLPPSGRKNRILSDFIRSRLGLITYRDRENESRFHFENLICSAKEAHIFYLDSDENEKSPFVEKMIWQQELGGKKINGETLSFKVSFKPGQPFPASKTPPILERLHKMSLSPTSIDTYMNCGLRFFYSYVLGMREKKEITEELNPADIGTIVHAILEEFFAGKAGKPLTINFDNDRNDIFAITEKIINQNFGSSSSGFEFLFKKQLFRRMEGVLSFYEKYSQGEIEIVRLETKVSAMANTKHGSIRINGKADRIDIRNGTVFIADYKTGSSAKLPNLKNFNLDDRAEWIKTLRSVQLPFYLMALNGEKEYAGRNKNAELIMLGQENIESKVLYPAKNINADAEEAGMDFREICEIKQAAFEQAIIMLAEEILDPEQKFRPAEDNAYCANCPFAASCGRT